MNILTAASKLEKDILNATWNEYAAKKKFKFGIPNDKEEEELYRQIEEHQTKIHWKQLEHKIEQAFKIQALIHDVKGRLGLNNTSAHSYFITVRPDTSKTTLANFIDMVKYCVSRRCFHTYILSFEQKGLTEDEYGKGFHCHIIATMTQRSKGEVLRDIKSTFKTIAAENCIQVDVLRKERDVDRVKKYLTDYESNDGHKIATRNADMAWRQQVGLHDLYENVLPSIKSDIRQQENAIQIAFD